MGTVLWGAYARILQIYNDQGTGEHGVEYNPAGPTGFAPGPVIGEMGLMGIKAGIVDGKVAIKEDSLIVKEGEVIKPEVAALLTRLKIEPMEIGLDLTATYEDGEIFTKDVLDINVQEYIDNLTNAHRWSFNLAVEAGIYNAQTTEFMVINAHSKARALAISQDILADEIVPIILAKAQSQMLAIKSLVPETVAETKKETQSNEVASVESETPEPKAEEVKEEPKVEETKEAETKPEEVKEEVKEPKTE